LQGTPYVISARQRTDEWEVTHFVNTGVTLV